MRLDVPRLVVAIALAAAGVVVLVRASQGGGPIYYFFSAVLFGMGIAAFQGSRGRERDADPRANDRSKASRGPKGRGSR
ncbi:MAG TPA: hypothetical protein VKZ43_09095 [Trueperaceae bacterium]|nr:hypothetical protein [Trueperaceae bacterium]